MDRTITNFLIHNFTLTWVEVVTGLAVIGAAVGFLRLLMGAL